MKLERDEIMGIELKPHNKQAYEQVEKIFEKNERAAVVHPTGTGKSYIALKLIENNQGKKVIYLAPSKSILHKIKDEMVKNSIKFREDDNRYVERLTYQKLTALNKSNNLDMNADIIILDEFHHCGAPEWGKAVKELLKQNSNAKVLGLSATPMRYFDEEIRDMAEEIFGKNIASEMSLEEAISSGILSEPQYTTGIYETDAIIREQEEKINNIPDSENKELAKKELEELKKALNASVKGLPELLRDNMPEKTGKYLIYCKNIEDMEKKIEEAKEMFSLVNEDIEIMDVSSKKSETENMNEIRRFEKKSKNEKLKLLFSVDMLNEGYHLKDLNGVIMMRPTYSPTLYDQQLGRALSVGGSKKPVIIDLVNNIDTIRIIENFGKRYIESKGEKSSTNVKGFSISEETRKISDIIAKIDSLVQRRNNLSQEEKLALMKRYIEETGEKIKTDTQFEGYNIGSMKNNLRYLYNQGKLNMDEDLLQEFIEMGIIVEEKERIRTTSQEKFDFLMEVLEKSPKELENYKMKNGWDYLKVKNQIQFEYNRGILKLSKEQIEFLKEKNILGYSKEEIEEIASQYDFYNLPKEYVAKIIKKYGSLEVYIDKYKKGEEEYSFSGLFQGKPYVLLSEKDITEEQKSKYYYLFKKIIDELKCIKNIKNIVVDFDSVQEILEDLDSVGGIDSRRVQALTMLYGLKNEQYSCEEISKILNCSTTTVGNDVKRVCQIMARRIVKYDIEIEEKKLVELKKECNDIEGCINDWKILKSIITNEDNNFKSEEIKKIRPYEYGFSGKILNLKDEDDLKIERITIEKVFENMKNMKNIDMLIEDLDFSVRTYNILHRGGIKTLGDLLLRNEEQIWRLRDLGTKSYNEIKEKIESMGFELLKDGEEIYTEEDLLDKYHNLTRQEKNKVEVTKNTDMLIEDLINICNTNLSRNNNRLETLMKLQKEQEDLVCRLHIARDNYFEKEDIFNPNGIVPGVPKKVFEQVQENQEQETLEKEENHTIQIKEQTHEENREDDENIQIENADEILEIEKTRRKAEIIESIKAHQQELERLKAQLAEIETSKDITNKTFGTEER